MYGKSSKKRYFLKKTGDKSLGIKQLYILVLDIIHFGKFLPGDQKICSIQGGFKLQRFELKITNNQ